MEILNRSSLTELIETAANDCQNNQKKLDDIFQEVNQSFPEVNERKILCIDAEPAPASTRIEFQQLPKATQEAYWTNQCGNLRDNTVSSWFRYYLGFNNSNPNLHTWHSPSENYSHGDIQEYDGIVITGSSEMVSQARPWYPELKEKIREIYRYNSPTLGVCFGHQIFAEALEGEIGKVTSNCGKKIREIGIVRIFSKENSWLLSRQKNIFVPSSHSEHVTKAPPGTAPTSSNQKSFYQGLKYGTKIETIQNHPEIVPVTVLIFMRIRIENILAELKNFHSSEANAITEAKTILDSVIENTDQALETRKNTAINFRKLIYQNLLY